MTTPSDIAVRLLAVACTAAIACAQRPPGPRALEVRIAHTPDAPAFAATLTLPPGAWTHPAILLVSPAGDHPRDELRSGGTHLADLATRLAAHGIASLRVDNRGVGGSRNERWPAWDWSVSIEELTRDLAGHVAWLRERPEIDRDRVGVLAHGDGTVPAARFAAGVVEGRRPAFLILLSASGRRGVEDLARRQTSRLPPELSDDERRALRERLRDALALLVSDGATPAATAAIQGCMTALGLSEASAEAQAKEFAATFGQRWYRDYLGHRPQPTLRAVECPVLVVLAADDDRVDAEASATVIAGAVEAEVRELPRGGHFLEPDDGRKILRDDVVEAVRRFVNRTD